MQVLVVGSGGREHALAWKLAQSPLVDRLYAAPGNGGTAKVAENVPIPATDVAELVTFAREREIDLTVVGPEAPLVAGLADELGAVGGRVFGPTAAAARLEGSKAFAKEFCFEEGIPTAPAAIFGDYEAAWSYLRQQKPPIVVKASGLAAGKGVLVCATMQEAEAALGRVMLERAFGTAGDQVLIEACLQGEETSLLAFCDGNSVVPMLPARDYKRALDGDQGLNTGGMGGYCPSPHLPPGLVEEAMRRVLRPAVDGMRRRGTPYVGVLYAGLMLTEQGMRVLEFNCRFGDPETQLLMPLLETDLAEVLLACVDGRLDETTVAWKPGHSVGVVLASGGYPGAYETGKTIAGLEAAAAAADVVFHAGTRLQGPGVVTSGGRVVTVAAVARDLAEARARAYAGAGTVDFDGMQYRTDIARVDGSLPEARPERGLLDGRAYVAAGVDIDAGERAVELMRAAVESTYTPAVLSGIGAFGGCLSLEELSREHDVVLVASTDGVGTKTVVAEAMGSYDTVGHDIVNHCVNDILVQGARPLLFLDYVAAAKLDPGCVARVVAGCAEACRSVGCVLIGGETAEMPGVYRSAAFDLVGTMIGWVDRDGIVDGSRVRAGDVCLGLPSSGLHTNGFSLARRVFADARWETVLPELGRPLGEVLLTPHRAYLGELEALWDAGVQVKAMAHITGGGFEANLPRVLPAGVGARLDRSAWDVLPIFQVIQAKGGISEAEMYRVFNMGIGMVLVVSPEQVDEALSSVPDALVVGEIFTWDGSGCRVEL
jgi:phosphoribosylamine--glycine ligase/phosphoribosylformylglycinamidine cyclo-ligase